MRSRIVLLVVVAVAAAVVGAVAVVVIPPYSQMPLFECQRVSLRPAHT